MTPLLRPVPFARTSRILQAEPDFELAAGEGWPARIMAEEIRDRYHAKQGRSIARWTLAGPDGSTLAVYLKRHYELPQLAGWLAMLFPRKAWSPGLQEWQHLAWARSVGLPVPRPVAAGEFRGPGGKLQSFLAVEELANMLPLNEAIPLAAATLAPMAFALWKRRLVADVARLARELHRRRAYHKDLYLCHFYLAQTDCAEVPDSFRGRLFVIDFHRLGRHRFLGEYFRTKDLAQLLFSSDDLETLTARDRLRFWHHYRRGDWGPAAGPPNFLRRAILWKWKQYRRHNLRRKARNGGGH